METAEAKQAILGGGNLSEKRTEVRNEGGLSRGQLSWGERQWRDVIEDCPRNLDAGAPHTVCSQQHSTESLPLSAKHIVSVAAIKQWLTRQGSGRASLTTIQHRLCMSMSNGILDHLLVSSKREEKMGCLSGMVVAFNQTIQEYNL